MSQLFQKWGLEIIQSLHTWTHSTLLILLLSSLYFFPHFLTLFYWGRRLLLFLLIVLQVYQNLPMGNLSFTLYVSYLLQWYFYQALFLLMFSNFLRLFIQLILIQSCVSHFYLEYFCHWIFKIPSVYCILVPELFSPTNSTSCLKFSKFSFSFSGTLCMGLLLNILTFSANEISLLTLIQLYFLQTE